jgi:CRISPR-associated protein Csm4
VLMADTGAVLVAAQLPAESFVGQGLGGDGRLSTAPGFEGTVQQGYAPFIGIRLGEEGA